jgi:methylmalonyl-CoA mutase
LDDTIIPLASDFAPPSRAEWLEIVEKTLKGAAFEKRLVSKAYDVPALQPLYTADQTMRSPARAFPAGVFRVGHCRRRRRVRR